MALALSRNMMGGFLEWHPTVLHDLHESVPFLYTSTGMGPYNAWLDPIVVDEWQKMAYVEIEADDQARRAGRLDARVLRRMGAELHVLRRQRA